MAVLQANGERQEFHSLDLLINKLLGTGLPVTALFAWLGGQARDSDGWQVDLSQKARKNPGAPNDTGTTGRTARRA